jgi:hypothetical protein
MPTVRIAAAGVVLWAALCASLRADSLTVTTKNGGWTYFSSGGDNSVLARFADSLDSTMNVPLTGGSTSLSAAPSPPPIPPVLASSNLFQSSGQGASSSNSADGFINFGSSGFPQASTLVSGTPQAWYLSPVVQSLFGGTPTPAQQAQFTSAVLNDVKQTFALAGMNPNITIDPSVPAAHTISVVSGATYGPNPNAIGITNVGGSGFGFIDKLGFASSVDQLEWAVAHNVSHEMMHAFGVATHADQTGTYIDAAAATPALLTSPNSTFSPGAVALINQTAYGHSAQSGTTGAQLVDGDQEVLQTVPEPASVVAWSLVTGVAAVRYARRSPRRAA